MTKPHSRPPRHLHVFGISLLLIVGALCVFLFGVKMEATVHGTGLVASGGVVHLRASKSARLKIAGLKQDRADSPGHEAIVPGSFLNAGDAVVWLVDDATPSEPIAAPNSSARWLVVDLPVNDETRVKEGELLASLVPVDAATNQVLDLTLRIEIDENQFGSVEMGQEVRMESNLHPHRTHGIAKGIVDRLEPMGVEGPNGSRKFVAWAKVTECPFPLKLGSSVRAEIVVGRKRTYQIILEH